MRNLDPLHDSLRRLIADAENATICRKICKSVLVVSLKIQTTVDTLDQINFRNNDEDPEYSKHQVQLHEWVYNLHGLIEEAGRRVKQCRVSGVFQLYRSNSRLTASIQEVLERLDHHPLHLPLVSIGDLILPHMLLQDLCLDSGEEDRGSLECRTFATPQVVYPLLHQPSTPYEYVIGMEGHIVKLQRRLLTSNPSQEPRCVGVLGVGGTGKTLLARTALTFSKVRKHFRDALVVWLTVGKNPSIRSLYTTLSFAAGLGYRDYSLHELRYILDEVLAKRKVLLILDDVCDEGVLKWLNLAKGLGSITLLTTRNKQVLQNIVQPRDIVHLSSLSRESSWVLFCDRAFQGSATVPPALENFARAMTEECQGLPLPLQLVGGSMAGNRDPLHWERELRNLRSSKMLRSMLQVGSMDSTNTSSVGGILMDCCQLIAQIHEGLKNVLFNHSQCAQLASTYQTFFMSMLNFLGILMSPAVHRGSCSRAQFSVLDLLLDLPCHGPNVKRAELFCRNSLEALRHIIVDGKSLVDDCFRWTAMVNSRVAPRHIGITSTPTPFILNLREFVWCIGVIQKTFADQATGTRSFDLQAWVECPRKKDLLGVVCDEKRRKQDMNRLLDTLQHLSRGDPKENKVQMAKFLFRKMQGNPPTANNLPDSFWVQADDVLKQGNYLHHGSYGIVMECTLWGIQMVVKFVKSEQAFLGEAIMLARLQHPNVVRMVGCYNGTTSTGVRTRMIAMERMQQNLRQLIDARIKSTSGPPFSEVEFMEIMLQIAEALQYLKSQRVMHRDVKSTNILVNVLDEAEGFGHRSAFIVKLTDFGSSRYKEDGSSFSTKEGSTPWMAPEVVSIAARRGGDVINPGYSWRADVYSFGITASEILTGEVPFKNVPRLAFPERLANGERPNLPVRCSAEIEPVLELVRRCWAQESCHRPTIFEVNKQLRECMVTLLQRRSGDSNPTATD